MLDRLIFYCKSTVFSRDVADSDKLLFLFSGVAWKQEKPPKGLIFPFTGAHTGTSAKLLHFLHPWTGKYVKYRLEPGLALNLLYNVWFPRDWFDGWGVAYLAQWYWLKLTRHGEPVCDFAGGGGKRPYEVILVGRRPVFGDHTRGGTIGGGAGAGAGSHHQSSATRRGLYFLHFGCKTICPFLPFKNRICPRSVRRDLQCFILALSFCLYTYFRSFHMYAGGQWF